MSTPQSCATCQFSKTEELLYPDGLKTVFFCHRRPPTAFNEGKAVFPCVGDGSRWCGEWALAVPH